MGYAHPGSASYRGLHYPSVILQPSLSCLYTLSSLQSSSPTSLLPQTTLWLLMKEMGPYARLDKAFLEIVVQGLDLRPPPFQI